MSMAYEKQTWVDRVTPLDAEHMNHIEDGIAELVGIESIAQTTTSTSDGGTNVITATLSNGTTAKFNIKNGSKGSTGGKGDTGATGAAGVGIKTVTQTTTSNADGGENVITVTKTDGSTSTFTVKNGSKGGKGDTGATGAAGYTPVKYTDYYTPADQESIVQQVIAALGTPVFGRVENDKTIVLSGDMPSGTYTFRFENADGVVTEMGDHELGERVPVETMLNITWSRETTISNSDGTLGSAGDSMSVSNEITLKSGAVYTIKNVGAWVNGIYCSTHAYWYGASGFIGRTHLTADMTNNTIPKDYVGTIEPMSGATKVRFRLNYTAGDYTAEDFVRFYETI